MREAIAELISSEDKTFTTSEVAESLRERYGWQLSSTRSLIARMGKSGDIRWVRRGVYESNQRAAARAARAREASQRLQANVDVTRLGGGALGGVVNVGGTLANLGGTTRDTGVITSLGSAPLNMGTIANLDTSRPSGALNSLNSMVNAASISGTHIALNGGLPGIRTSGLGALGMPKSSSGPTVDDEGPE